MNNPGILSGQLAHPVEVVHAARREDVVVRPVPEEGADRIGDVGVPAVVPKGAAASCSGVLPRSPLPENGASGSAPYASANSVYSTGLPTAQNSSEVLAGHPTCDVLMTEALLTPASNRVRSHPAIRDSS